MKGLWRVTLLATVLCAVGAAPAADEAESPEIQFLRQELAKMRLELAEAKLQVGKTLRELEELRQFMSSRNVTEDIQQWRRERREIEAERRRLEAERRRLEQMRQTVRDASRLQVEKIQAEKKAPQPAVALEPQANAQIDYKVALIPTNAQIQTVYVDPTTGAILMSRYGQEVDRKNIKLRGTLQNRSSKPWRYTFEIRLGGRSVNAGRAPIIGRWRYQTPMLTPNELHTFEFKVPVTDVADIHSYQIGNLESDQVGPPPAGKAP